MANVIDSNNYILISENKNIKTLPNQTNLYLVKGSNLVINILVLPTSSADILVLDSKNTIINIECSGISKLTEINLDENTSKLNVTLVKEEATFEANVLSIAKHFNSTFNQNVVHKAKKTASNINNYGISMDSSKIHFETIGKIEKGMSKSKMAQLSRGVIMDDDSQVTSNPILLIDEYDVIANHGAAIGKMSDDVMFYLMSRGLTKNDAFLLYLDGIINPFMKNIKDEKLQKVVLDKINNLIVR